MDKVLKFEEMTDKIGENLLDQQQNFGLRSFAE